MIKVKAIDSFFDGRAGMVHAHQVVEVTEQAAKDLIDKGFVKLVTGEPAEKKLAPVENKMQPTGALTNKAKKAK